MSEPFDPYRKWLGIPPKDQPPNHYRLLGIATFESDPDVIENAAARQMAHIRTFQGSRHAALSQRLLTELSAAKVCLLVPADKEPYDARLREKLLAEGKLSSEAPLGQGGEAVAALPKLPPMPGSVRAGEARWRTEGASPPPLVEAPPVPIPLPMGTAVAAVPSLRRNSAASYRSRKKQSALPLAIMIASAVVLVGGGLVAFIVFNNPSPTVNHASGKPKPVPAYVPPQPPAHVSRPQPGSTPISSHELEARRPAIPREHRPLPLKSYSPASTEFPLGLPETTTPEPTPAPVPAVTSEPGSSGSTTTEPATPAVDRLRQQLFLSRQALGKRDDETFTRQITLAEQVAAEPSLDESLRRQLKEEIEHLRNLKTLIDQFWTTVRENLANQFKPGEPFGLFKARFELVSLAGEVVTYKFGDEQRESPIRDIDPVAAALVAGKTAKITEPATLMPILAFLSIDEQAEQKHAEDHVVKFARRFFSENKLAGQRNLEIAARLGIKLATELPLE